MPETGFRHAPATSGSHALPPRGRMPGAREAGTVATVDIGAIRHNYRDGLSKLSEGATPSAVIKADGYGLGATKLAQVLIQEGCRDFFVARISEAVELRRALQAEDPQMARKVAINVLDGPLAGSDPQVLIDHQITPVLNSLEQVRTWNQAAERFGKPLPAILQIDSGMNRAGVPPEELPELLDNDKAALSHIKLQCIMSHLAKAGDATPNPPRDESRRAGADSRAQLFNFDHIAAAFPGVEQSIGASSTVFLEPEFQKDMVRMGGTFHGQAPFEADSNPLRSVLTLQSKIAQTRQLPQGEGVGYGLNFTGQQPMTTVAALSTGYADGIPRTAGGNREGDPPIERHVLVDGKYKAPMIGATSMDMTTIDVSNVPPEALRPGTPVTLIGGPITPDHFGAMHGTGASETLVKLTKRVHIEHREDPRVPPPPPSDHASKHAWEG
jgi:alanine racemase